MIFLSKLFLKWIQNLYNTTKIFYNIYFIQKYSFPKNFLKKPKSYTDEKKLSGQKMPFLDRFFLLWTLFKWDWSIVLVGLTYNCITRIPKNFTKVSKNAKICSSHEDRLWKGKKTLVFPQNISFSLTKYKIFCQTVLNVKSSEDFVSQIKVYVSFYLENLF